MCCSAWADPAKKSLHAAERNTPRAQQARQAYRRRLTGLDLQRLTFVDESRVHLAMTRAYGRAPAGERVVRERAPARWPPRDHAGGVGPHGLQAVMTVDGATEADVFRTYVKQVLGPTLAPGDSVVMDHLRAHNAVGVQPALARRGARVLYVPPDSPDLSPTSNPAGRRSTPACAPPRRARVKRSTPPLRR